MMPLPPELSMTSHGLVLPSRDELKRLPPDGGERWNRLVFESSPYLLQHAGNPVDWYPWGDEAFETARRLDRPVFLSVGYSTCHWCHVMERESFEDAEVAALLNAAFVCVKVDREERPDVDHVYMTVTQALTGSGGWPMTVVLTPDKKPFFAGTYFPKHGRHGRAGMTDLLPRLSEAWREHRDHVVEEAQRITDAVAGTQATPAGGAMPTADTLRSALRQLESRFDPKHGGFGRAPKFPTPHQLSFLLRRHAREGDEHALAMVEKTLVEMRAGGIFDQVGFGIHRYSTDERWLVPHFEKMLYDQALTVIAAVECFQATGDERHAAMARDVLEYVRRDMTSPGGAFYSAEDADAEGEEGRFTVWTAVELREVLGADDAALVTRVWSAEEEGNFLEEATRRPTGSNILHRTKENDELAEEMGLTEGELATRLESARLRLFEARERRVHPLKDDKVLTDWNGLMIAAFAKAGRALKEPAYERAAVAAAEDVLERLVLADGRCLKRMRDGQAGLQGMLDDHAFLAWGLLELHATTFEDRWLRDCVRVTSAMIAHFADEAGGFFLSPDDGEKLPVRGKDAYDGALPSGNSVAALVLVQLGLLTGDTAYRERADGVLRAFSESLERGASAHCVMLMALDLALGPTREVVIAGERDAPDTRALVDVTRSGFRPDLLTLLRTPLLAELAPFTAAMTPIDGRAAAYACSGTSCSAPVTSPADLQRLLATP
jgi:uncharacterized protein